MRSGMFGRPLAVVLRVGTTRYIFHKLAFIAVWLFTKNVQRDGWFATPRSPCVCNPLRTFYYSRPERDQWPRCWLHRLGAPIEDRPSPHTLPGRRFCELLREFIVDSPKLAVPVKLPVTSGRPRSGCHRRPGSGLLPGRLPLLPTAGPIEKMGLAQGRSRTRCRILQSQLRQSSS